MKPQILILLSVIFLISCGNVNENKQNESKVDAQKTTEVKQTLELYPELINYIENNFSSLDSIPEERKEQLQLIADYIVEKKNADKEVKLVFICTHNSRRSHMSQIWAASLAKYFEYDFITTFSGGTESTAFNPRAVAAIERAGFRIQNPGGENPRYLVSTGNDTEPMVCFSKVFDDPSNPVDEFAAIMVCSDADQNCPFIAGAEKRFSLPYEDPKVADGTEYEAAKYDERCRQISMEFLYLMKQI